MNRWTAFAVGAALCASGLAMAQDYPSRPIRVVIPNTPGGAIDVAARVTQPRMQELLGQPLVLDYRVAAGGVVGTNQVAQSAPDGYTLVMVFDSFVTNTFLFADVKYDPVKDFEPVSLMMQGVQVLLVNPGLGVKTFGDFMQLAKTRGPALDFATAGPGTSSRFTMELFKEATGIDSTAIHYKGGGALVPAMLSGQVGVTIITLGVAAPQIKAGKLLALAVTSAKRTKLLPDVPTIAETYPGFEAQSWLGLLAPAGTSRPIVERLNAAVTRSLAAGDVHARLEDLGYDVVGSNPDAFGAWIRNESAKWGKLIRDRNIKLEQ